MASYTDADASQDNSTVDSDFETDLAIIGYKIETYFSSLIDLIAKRRNDLLSELDEVLTEFLEEKRKIEERRQELEEMLRYHEDRSFSPNVRELQDSFLSRIRNELSEVSNHKAKKTIRFEWNPKYVREASKIGILHVSSENDIPSYPDDTLYDESTAENSLVEAPLLRFKSTPNKGDKWIDNLNPRLNKFNFRLESSAEGPMNSQDFPDDRSPAYTPAYFDSQAEVEPMSMAKRSSQDFHFEGPKKKYSKK